MDNHEGDGKAARIWYLSHFGNREGPYSLEEAREVVTKQTKSKALCWKEGMESWVPVSQQAEFTIADEAAMPARRVSWPLAAGILFVPYVFVWWLLRKGHGTLARAVGFSWAGLAFIAFLGGSGPQEKRENANLASQVQTSGESLTPSESRKTCSMGFLSSAYVIDGRVDFKVDVWNDRVEWVADKILERAFEVAEKCQDATTLRATVTAEAQDRYGNTMPDQSAVFDIDLDEARKYRDAWKYKEDGNRAILAIGMSASNISYAFKR